MDDKTKAALTNLETWKRGFFMIVFAIISGVAKLIVTLVAIFQFVTLLVKGQTNEAVVPFGQNLSSYIYQITLFLTFNTEVMPFPFNTFPDGAPGTNINTEEGECMPSAEAKTKSDEQAVDKGVDKNSKDDPLMV